ncbi:MAG: DUF1636 domain-containing protein [Rhodospirillales bacterium]|nr:DUF1636 domain-containing protein [Rhodospirillales bacterium]MBO6788338.1 DUF1636 domain-containing protein [Rhodospirillales bacterium]
MNRARVSGINLTMDTHNQDIFDGLAAMDDADTVRISVCGTCIDCSNAGEAGIGAGARLFEKMTEARDGHPCRDVLQIEKIRCLMACTEGCTLTIGARGKMKYLLGRLEPSDDLVEQVLDFAAMYAASPSGVTPNHEWPPLLAPHFIGRVPPCEPNDPGWEDDGADL